MFFIVSLHHTRKYTLDKIVVEQAEKILTKCDQSYWKVCVNWKGLEEGPIQSWMKIHGASANIPSEIIEQAIDFFREAEPKMVVADDELKALAWLLLVCRTVDFKLTNEDTAKAFPEGQDNQLVEWLKRIQSTLTIAMTNINLKTGLIQARVTWQTYHTIRISYSTQGYTIRTTK